MKEKCKECKSVLNKIEYPKGWDLNLCSECNEYYEYGQLKPKSYFKGFNILMEYWESLPDEEKPKINKRLKKLGL